MLSGIAFKLIFALTLLEGMEMGAKAFTDERRNESADAVKENWYFIFINGFAC
jgi:hypothetical protein